MSPLPSASRNTLPAFPGFAFVLAFLLFGTAPGRSAPPSGMLGFQGRVTTGHVPFNGTGLFRFALVDAAGTTTHWSNDGTSTTGNAPVAAVSVPVTLGLYSVLLGDTSLSGMTTSLDPSVFGVADLRLRIWFDDGVHGSQLLAPDRRVAVTAYSLVAGSVPDGSVMLTKLAPGVAAVASTPGSLVVRDDSGGFSAGTISLEGGLWLPATSDSGAGEIRLGGYPFLHGYGSDNSFVGLLAGNYYLTGQGNSGFGRAALTALQSGAYNTAIGMLALSSDTSGGYDTSVGAGSLMRNDTGSFNTAVGAFALSFNTNGTGNSAVGVDALFNNVSGSDNAALGGMALLGNVSGSGNTAVGHGALKTLAAGTNNVGLGLNAGVNHTAGSNNLDIGSPGVEGDSGTIRLGTPGMHGKTFLVGNVGIGTNSAAERLEVAGRVVLGDSANGTPKAGTVRWTGKDFEGFNGTRWISLSSDPNVVTPVPGMVWIRPGSFAMGSPDFETDRELDEGPLTSVTITRGFWMGRCEVTQAEYQAVVGSNPSSVSGDPRRPVDSVSWNDAVAYCAALTASERGAGRIPGNWGYRLPTEAEWEYAARAGTATRFSFGDDPGYVSLPNYAWVTSPGVHLTEAHPVGTKAPNAWGLFDLHGNVWEMCLDWYAAYPGGSVIDPQGGPATGGMHVVRPGGWAFTGRYCRSAARFATTPDFKYSSIGFRIVLSPNLP